MKLLHKMILKDFIPVLIVALFFFAMIIQLLDLFANLWRYLNKDLTLFQIALITGLFTPKCLSYSLPVSILFSVSYNIGTYYSRNELIAVYSSGISLFQLVKPLIIAGIILSVMSFFFEDRVVIPSFRKKTELSNELLGRKPSLNNDKVTIMVSRGAMVYSAAYYNDEQKTLSDLTVIFRDEKGGFHKRIESDLARWDADGQLWTMENVRIFTLEPQGQISLLNAAKSSDPEVNEPPGSFRRIVTNVDELPFNEARNWIKTLKRAGLPYREFLTELHKRLSFSLTPLIVILISSSMGGWFRKNILLMSLLFSLIVAVVYYVTQMITSILAKWGTIPPFWGAWLATIVFLVMGIILLYRMRN
jgi:lipopolysaccharide export system permease protein